MTGKHRWQPAMFWSSLKNDRLINFNLLVQVGLCAILILGILILWIWEPFKPRAFPTPHPPYPPSLVIGDIEWDFDGVVRLAPGSDLWPVTWSTDDHIYTSWGDGGGFSGTNLSGRVSLGFGRIEGQPENLIGVNIWGGKNALTPATFEGKVAGLVSIKGILYAWLGTETGRKLIWSEDYAYSWQAAFWEFSRDTFVPFTILNFGKDYAGARDGYVYNYGHAWGESKDVYLVRVAKEKMNEQAAYEFFGGLRSTGDPVWTANPVERKPVFSDPSGTDHNITPTVTYNPGIGRYLLSASWGGPQRLGIFDAPEPWGPWATVVYDNNWGGYRGREALLYSFPTKWISEDGMTMWMIFSSTGKLDSFNLIRATLVPASE